MKAQIARGLCLTAAAVCLSLACQTTQTLEELFETIPAKNLEYYAFAPDAAPSRRVNVSPDILMAYLDEYDNPAGDYALYEPTDHERELLDDYLELLPDRYQAVLKERLISFYFVDNFLGSGMADYVLSETNEIYVILVLNPIVFEKDLSGLLTYKENTTFRTDGKGPEVSIEVSGDYSGLLYILAHECTHIVDYVDRITPYVEPGFNTLFGTNEKATPFTTSHWSDYHKTKEPLAYGDKLRFYSIDEDHKISDAEMYNAYSELKTTHFVSLYSYLTWAEDLADYCTFYHLTQNLGLTYSIRLIKEGMTVFEYEPFGDPGIVKRAEVFDFL